MIRLVVFSAVRLFGDALAACLENEEHISEATSCHSANRVVAKVVAFKPDAVLFDINGKSAMQEAFALRSAVPEVPLLAIAIPETPEQVIACADAGFSGYVPLQASVAEVCAIVDMAIRRKGDGRKGDRGRKGDGFIFRAPCAACPAAGG